MNRVILLRGLDTSFGIIPQPKYEENQDGYSCVCSYGNTNSISVPIINTDMERTGIMLESLSFESSLTTLPAYIETSVKTKYARDEESAEMLDLIFASRAFDLGLIFNWGSSGLYTSMLNSGAETFASKIASSSASYIAAMQKTVDLFEGIA